MNSENFNKLFSLDEEVKAAEIRKMSMIDQLKLMDKSTPRKEKLELIEKKQEPIPDDVLMSIRQFIGDQQAQGKSRRQIRRAVKKKFNITVVV